MVYVCGQYSTSPKMADNDSHDTLRNFIRDRGLEFSTLCSGDARPTSSSTRAKEVHWRCRFFGYSRYFSNWNKGFPRNASVSLFYSKRFPDGFGTLSISPSPSVMPQKDETWMGSLIVVPNLFLVPLPFRNKRMLLGNHLSVDFLFGNKETILRRWHDIHSTT